MKICIALPCYDFKVYSETMISIFNCCDQLKKDGHEVGQIICNNGNCYVSDARNKLAEMFLKTTYDSMIFVDSDVAFDSSAMSALLATDKNIVGGVYTKKSENGEYPLQVVVDEKEMIVKDGNYFKCMYLPTGLLKINRCVFDKFRKAFPEQQGKHYYTYFEDRLDKETGIFIGEDVFFCNKCREMGEAIWCYPNIDFRHIGMKEYKGNYYKYLRENAQRG